MKKINLLIILILICTTGCLNYTELNDIGIINTIGINKEDNNYIIDINMLTPTEKDLEKDKVYQIEAKSLNEAFDKLYLKTSKKINLSHLELMILSNNLNKYDYDNLKDFFINRTDTRNTFNVVILENYNSDNLFLYTQEEINNLILTNYLEDGLVSQKTFDELIEDILSIQESYLPAIEINKDMTILGYQKVYKNNKLLSKEDSIAYNFITNKINKCIISDKDTNIRINKSNTIIDISKNIITININSTILTNESNNNIKDKYNKIMKAYIENLLKNNDLELFKDLIKKHNHNKSITNIKYKINIKSKYNMEVYK